MTRVTSFGILLAVLLLPVAAEAPKPAPVAVPFELLSRKHIVIMVKVNGKGPYRVIFDTGAPLCLLNTKIGKEAGLVTKDDRSGFSLFGPVAQVKVKEFELGRLKVANLQVIIMDHPSVELMSEQEGPIDGIIGFPFFAQYAMTLDYQAQQLTFVPNGFVPADILQILMRELLAGDKPVKKTLAPAALWGFTVEKKTGDVEDGVMVKQVFGAGPAAAAGLQVGDRLLTFDDRWTDSVDDCYVAAGSIKPGTATKMVVKREGKEVELLIKPVVGL
jgi:hypothetical protein